MIKDVSVLILNKFMARRSSWDRSLSELEYSDFTSDVMVRADIILIFDNDNFRELKHRFKRTKSTYSLKLLSEYLRVETTREYE